MKIVYAVMIAAVAATGCASPGDYYASVQRTNDANLEIARVRAEADKARWMALGQIAASGDNTAKAVASVALAMGGGQGGQATQAIAPQQAQDPALAWASVIVPTGGQVALRAIDASLGKVQALANRDVAVANAQGMVSLGTAGVSGVTTTATAGLTAQGATAQGGYTALVGLGQAALKVPPSVTITSIGSGNTDSHNISGSYNPTTSTSTTTDNHAVSTDNHSATTSPTVQ